MEVILAKWRRVKRSGTFNRRAKKNNLLPITPSINEFNRDPAGQSPGSSDTELGGNLIQASINRNIAPQDLSDVSLESVQSNSSESLEEINKKIQLVKSLRKWAADFNIRQTALKRLINILNAIGPFSLPQDPRTLLGTPKTVHITTIGNSKYWHQGLPHCLKLFFRNAKRSMNISLNVNIDGLPIAKSSKEEFWPILCQIHEFPDSRPVVIGIYSGVGQPSNLTELLTPFVNDMKSCEQININGHTFNRAIICDSPARAFVKGVVNFNNQNGCQRCTTVVEYSYVSHCNIFPRTQCPKRTDVGFRQKLDESHHKCTTPLEQFPIDMVSDFPIGDALHLIDLGIMKRCLLGWRDGSFKTFKAKWSGKEIAEISNFLVDCQLPSEIHRKVRGLDCLAHWKGLEFRSFFYYIGIVILKDYLATDIYQHFLLLFCAITICSSEQHMSQFLSIAEQLLDNYVEIYRNIYGEAYITSNIHNLTHLIDDIRRFGILSTFHAYPFENMLYQLKMLLRQGNCPLAQVAKRLSEAGNLTKREDVKNNRQYPALKCHIDCNVLGEVRYSKVEIASGFLLSNDVRNQWCLTKSNVLLQYKYTIVRNNNIYVCGRSVKQLTNFFEKPIRSSYLHIYMSTCDLEEKLSTYLLTEIKCKMVSISYKTTKIFIPLIHTLK